MPAWQGLWTHEAGNPAGHSLLVNKSFTRNRIRRFANDEQFRATGELFDTLIGATAGGTALATSRKVAAEAVTPTQLGQMGGARAIETRTHINRATTAADVTELKAHVFGVRARPATYVRDLSGNGGPAYTNSGA